MLCSEKEPRTNSVRRQSATNGCKRMDFSKTGLVAGAVVAALAFSTVAHADIIVGPLRFNAESLRVVDLRGTINVEVTPGSSQISVVIEGEEDEVQNIKVQSDGGVLVIEQVSRLMSLRRILNLGFIRFLEDNPKIAVSVPPRTPLAVDDFVGEIRVGDLDAPLALKGRGSVKGRIGNVTEAEIDLFGSTEIDLGRVSGRIDLVLRGSSDVRVVSSGTATIEASGSSEVHIGPVAGDLKIDSSGSTQVVVESVNGSLSIRSSGSSDVDIGGGRADPLSVRVSGAATISFAGNANDPDIMASGSANIRIGSVTGQIRTRGGGSIVIGN